MSAPKLTEAQRLDLERVYMGNAGSCLARHLDDLEWAGLICRTDPNFGASRYDVTPAGRAALKDGAK